MALLLEGGGRLLLEGGSFGLTVTKYAASGIGEVTFIGVAPATAKVAPAGIGLIEFVGIPATATEPFQDGPFVWEAHGFFVPGLLEADALPSGFSEAQSFAPGFVEGDGSSQQGE